MEWKKAPDIKRKLRDIVKRLTLTHIDARRVICFRSFGSTSRARARIWSFPKVWQLALNIPPAYVVEVLSERFDHLSLDDQTRVLIHELMHIPKNFSGALVSHKGRYHQIDGRNVDRLFRIFLNNKNNS